MMMRWWGCTQDVKTLGAYKVKESGGECHNMRQGVMGNASIFARELGDALDLAKTNYQ